MQINYVDKLNCIKGLQLSVEIYIPKNLSHHNSFTSKQTSVDMLD